jgi:hypothetical protein
MKWRLSRQIAHGAKRFSEALAILGNATQIIKRLAAKEPTNKEWRYQLIESLADCGVDRVANCKY